MKDTNEYWINEFVKLYFCGYPVWLIKKVIHERRKNEDVRIGAEVKNNILSTALNENFENNRGNSNKY